MVKYLDIKRRSRELILVPFQTDPLSNFDDASGPTIIVDHDRDVASIVERRKASYMNFSELLKAKGIEPKHVLLLRHRPKEPELRKFLPWWAEEKPDLFNAYQQTQSGHRAEAAIKKAAYVASFIGTAPRQALFIGLYSMTKYRSLSQSDSEKRRPTERRELLGLRPLLQRRNANQ